MGETALSFYDSFTTFLYTIFGARGVMIQIWNYVLSNDILLFSFGLGIFSFALVVVSDIVVQKESNSEDED